MTKKEKPYKVQFEIAGPAAIFTRPDTGATPISYPAPTYSAAKGMFESIARIKSAFIKPTRVEICSPIHYHHYTNNYHGPLRKSGTDNFQLFATILINVCYRIYGEVKELSKPDLSEVITTNHLHLLQEKFNRRLRNGRWYHIPCLGWNEFTPTYLGRFREETKIEESIEQIIPSMLFSVFAAPGKYDPSYKQNVWIKKGVLEYVE
ncbi:MAG: CRISPR-associated protein Cas5 [Ignavibacteriaceae bacterium]|nr:CRISPR-associated protein Cas5 [Ignavibacteriaceae bacterium]